MRACAGTCVREGLPLWRQLARGIRRACASRAKHRALLCGCVRVRVCARACACVRARVRARARLRVCVRARLRVCVGARAPGRARASVCVRAGVRARICTRECARVCAPLCPCACVPSDHVCPRACVLSQPALGATARRVATGRRPTRQRAAHPRRRRSTPTAFRTRRAAWGPCARRVQSRVRVCVRALACVR
eukprot:6206185-Pleurochrysis_carterae.AAC.1